MVPFHHDGLVAVGNHGVFPDRFRHTWVDGASDGVGLKQDVNSILITDFDGTITRHDFYELVVPSFLEDSLPDYWTLYHTGQITHFEAMRDIFGHIRCEESALRRVVEQMQPDPELAGAVERLRGAGWEVEVVSAGSRWYIDQVLATAGVEVTVHASPGAFYPDKGLVMELPKDSLYCSSETGIDKAAVVAAAKERYERVAFAGNGPPDFEPAVRVAPEYRFARDWLARELQKRSLPYQPFAVWSNIADRLTQNGRGSQAPPA